MNKFLFFLLIAISLSSLSILGCYVLDGQNDLGSLDKLQRPVPVMVKTK